MENQRIESMSKNRYKNWVISLNYLDNIMDVIEKNGQKSYYIVMDDASIHKLVTGGGFIEKEATSMFIFFRI